jgi:hypothetical protein
MVSTVVIIFILLIQLPYQTSQFETIHASLASSVELPCSVGQNIELKNPAKVSAGRDKCLYV